jgi:hypothetical protein
VKRRAIVLSLLALVGAAALAGHAGSAADIRGTLANGWQRHPVGEKGSSVQLAGVYAGDSGFFGVSGNTGWVSANGATWKTVPGSLAQYALGQHIPDFNLTRIGITGVVKGYTYSVRKEGPNGGYIAVGEYQPPGQPVTKTRAEVALSTDGISFRHVSDKGKAFAGAALTDVARGGPGWVAVGFPWAPSKFAPVWTSPDAIHWTRLPAQPAFSQGGQITRLIHGPAGLLAIANGLDGSAQTWASADGLHWQPAVGNPFRGAFIMQVTAGGPGYLAAGMQDDDPALWSSADGLHWQREAGAAAFPGDLTALEGVAAKGSMVVVVGRYAIGKIGQFGVQFANPVGSAWVWTPQSSALTPTPAPWTGTIDPKLFRLRLADLPETYFEWDLGGWPDFCDDGSTLCRYVHNAVGSYAAYETHFAGPHLTAITGISIEGSHSNARALTGLGTRLVQWSYRGVPYKRVSTTDRIGQETRIYRSSPPAPSNPPGGHLTSYAVEWRDGKAIGQVYVAQQSGAASPVLNLAVALARAQWQHLRDARG